MTRPVTERNQALTAFYREHQRRLARIVTAVVRGVERTVIDDACQFAWTQLVRRADVNLDPGGLQWLVTTATREAWRLAAHREQPAGSLHGDRDPDQRGELPEPAGDATDPADRATEREQHYARVRAFSQLKPRERRELYLHALGYRYADIARLTGSTYTAVNRRISEGRAQLRALQPPDENH